jgi:hypothetical protein
MDKVDLVLHTAGEASPIVRVVERYDPKILGWALRYSRHDPALMLRERAPKALARRRRIDERVKEHRSISLRQYKRLMLSDRSPRGVCKGRHAEIGELAPFEFRGPFDQSFGWFVHPNPSRSCRSRRSRFAVEAMGTSNFVCTSIGLTLSANFAQ